MLSIVGKQRQILVNGRGRNQDIKITDNLTCLSQLATDLCKAAHNRLIRQAYAHRYLKKGQKPLTGHQIKTPF